MGITNLFFKANSFFLFFFFIEKKNKGEEGDAFYIIKWGNAIVNRRDDSGTLVHLAKLGAGDFFGEMALSNDEPRLVKKFSLFSSRFPFSPFRCFCVCVCGGVIMFDLPLDFKFFFLFFFFF